MHRITHQQYIDQLPESPLKTYIQKRFQQLIEDSGGELIPIIILVEPDDDITGPDYAFIGSKGLLSDAYEQHATRGPEFMRPYKWVSH